MSFFRSDHGTTAMEYGLIASLMSLALVAGALSAGAAVSALFGSVGAVLRTVAATI